MLSVIVPTYNERQTLPLLMERLREVARDLPLEVVVVDDNSPDGTGSLAEELGRSLAPELPVTVVHRPGKGGLSSAVLDGVRVARGDCITVMDADLSHPPEMLPRLVKAVMEGFDIAIASRYVPGGGIQRWPLWRRVVSIAATALARTVLGLSVRDPLSGFFTARRSILEGRPFLALGYKLLLEVLARSPEAKVIEVPYTFVNRQDGKSKLGIHELWDFLALLAELKKVHRGHDAPRV
jgi:dolichol-phosphate mannosyltransferase